MISQVHRTGWISVNIGERFEHRAKKTHAERDRQYANIFSETKTDERWVGDLGEKMFDSCLKKEEVKNFEWILNEAAGKAGFIIASRLSMGVKTVKRQVPLAEDFTAQVTARHANEPISHFSFISYQFKELPPPNDRVRRLDSLDCKL